jgi:hypothetical protein
LAIDRASIGFPHMAEKSAVPATPPNRRAGFSQLYNGDDLTIGKAGGFHAELSKNVFRKFYV